MRSWPESRTKGCHIATPVAQSQPHPRAWAQGGVITHTTRIAMKYRECRHHPV